MSQNAVRYHKSEHFDEKLFRQSGETSSGTVKQKSGDTQPMCTSRFLFKLKVNVRTLDFNYGNAVIKTVCTLPYIGKAVDLITDSWFFRVEGST